MSQDVTAILDASSGEELLRSGAANLQRGLEQVGGHLHLTTRRLFFVSHGLNLSDGSLGFDLARGIRVTRVEPRRYVNIPLADLAGARPCFTRVLGIPLVPNSIEVRTGRGQSCRFVVMGRGAWVSALEEARARSA